MTTAETNAGRVDTGQPLRPLDAIKDALAQIKTRFRTRPRSYERVYRPLTSHAYLEGRLAVLDIERRRGPWV